MVKGNVFLIYPAEFLKNPVDFLGESLLGSIELTFSWLLTFYWLINLFYTKKQTNIVPKFYMIKYQLDAIFYIFKSVRFRTLSVRKRTVANSDSKCAILVKKC